MRVFRFLLLPAALALAACEMDSYEKGTGGYSLLTAEFVEAHTGARGTVDYVMTDAGERLTLSPAPAPEWASAPDTVYRAVLYYDRAGGGEVRPRALSEVPVAAVQPSASLDTVVTDPLELESAWLSASGRWLNLGLVLMTGEGGGSGARQTLGLVCDSVKASPGGVRTAHLRLYHDQGGVPEYYSAKTYVSVACGQVGADSVVLGVETYGGTVRRAFRLSEQ